MIDSQDVQTYSVHVPLLWKAHVDRHGVSFLLWDLQSLPQLLDLLPISHAQRLVLSLADLQLQSELRVKRMRWTQEPKYDHMWKAAPVLSPVKMSSCKVQWDSPIILHPIRGLQSCGSIAAPSANAGLILVAGTAGRNGCVSGSRRKTWLRTPTNCNYMYKTK